jgi:hypothetical protein
MERMQEKLGERSQDPRDLGRMLCEEGLNGWIIPHNYSNPPGDDIMICDPDKWMSWDGEQFLDE